MFFWSVGLHVWVGCLDRKASERAQVSYVTHSWIFRGACKPVRTTIMEMVFESEEDDDHWCQIDSMDSTMEEI